MLQPDTLHFEVERVDRRKHRHAKPEVLELQVVGLDIEGCRFALGGVGFLFFLPDVHIKAEGAVAELYLIEQYAAFADIGTALVVDFQEARVDAQDH